MKHLFTMFLVVAAVAGNAQAARKTADTTKFSGDIISPGPVFDTTKHYETRHFLDTTKHTGSTFFKFVMPEDFLDIQVLTDNKQLFINHGAAANIRWADTTYRRERGLSVETITYHLFDKNDPEIFRVKLIYNGHYFRLYSVTWAPENGVLPRAIRKNRGAYCTYLRFTGSHAFQVNRAGKITQSAPTQSWKIGKGKWTIQPAHK